MIPRPQQQPRGRESAKSFSLYVLGQGIRDIAYFVMLSLDNELRRAHERALVEGYYALHALGLLDRVIS